MNYTFSITSKGQITIPKEFRMRLGLDKLGKATLSMNSKNEVIMTAPKTLEDVRALLRTQSFKDKPSERERIIGSYLANKYDVR